MKMKTTRRDNTKEQQLATREGRLFSVSRAAAYLGVGVWTVRDLIQSGYLPRVMLPSARRPGEAMRRILVDRGDLDQLIQRFREDRTFLFHRPTRPLPSGALRTDKAQGS